MTGSLLAQPIARWLGVGPAICLSGALSALGTMILLLSPATPVGAMTGLMVSQFLGDAFGVIPLILASNAFAMHESCRKTCSAGWARPSGRSAGRRWSSARSLAAPWARRSACARPCCSPSPAS